MALVASYGLSHLSHQCLYFIHWTRPSG
jgi:hypothetical protein